MITFRSQKTMFSILCIFISILLSCGSGVVEVDGRGNWSDYIKIYIIDNTIDKDGIIYPEIIVEINKIADIEIQYLDLRVDYNYGYEYLSKRENFILDSNSSEIVDINNGETISRKYNYKTCDKIQIEGYDNMDYDIYNPPAGSLPNVNPMIMYGLKIGWYVNKLNFKEK